MLTQIFDQIIEKVQHSHIVFFKEFIDVVNSVILQQKVLDSVDQKKFFDFYENLIKENYLKYK